MVKSSHSNRNAGQKISPRKFASCSSWSQGFAHVMTSMTLTFEMSPKCHYCDNAVFAIFPLLICCISNNNKSMTLMTFEMSKFHFCDNAVFAIFPLLIYCISNITLSIMLYYKQHSLCDTVKDKNIYWL